MRKFLIVLFGIMTLSSLAFAGDVLPGRACTQDSQCKRYMEPVACVKEVCCEKSMIYECTRYRYETYCAQYGQVCRPRCVQINGRWDCSQVECHQECIAWGERQVCAAGYYPWNCEPQEFPE